MLKEKNNIKGFSLIEILVSISIITLLSTVFLANIRGYGQTGGLDITAQKLASDIRMVQSYSLGLKEHDDGTGLKFPTGGWGIRFDRDAEKYTIFADHIPDAIYTNGSELLRDVDISKAGVKIDSKISTYKNGSWRDGSYAFITFEPPYPVVHLGNSNNATPPPWRYQDADLLKVTLISEATGDTRSVIINKFGLVDVTD